MRAAIDFVGVIGGEEKHFRAGDTITAAEAKELGLTDKPHLVVKDKGK